MGSSVISEIRKRSGRSVPFDHSKIADAVFKAAQSVGGADRQLAEELADVVVLFLEKQYGPNGVPSIEEIQDMVEKVLIETGHAQTAKAYILYRDKRTQSRRRLCVRKPGGGKTDDSTDMALMVSTGQMDQTLPWSKLKIVQALEVECDLDADTAGKAVSYTHLTLPTN